jgi:hypothetical protein
MKVGKKDINANIAERKYFLKKKIFPWDFIVSRILSEAWHIYMLLTLH